MISPSLSGSRFGAVIETDGERALPARTTGTEHRIPFHSLALAGSPPGVVIARPAQAWWLWLHLLGLDAPLVAVIWEAGWARTAHVTLPWSRFWIVGLGVRLIYLADRLADTARAIPGDHVTPRHAFHTRRRVALSWLASGVAAVLVLLAPNALSRAEFLLGLFPLTLAVTYFCLIHGGVTKRWTIHLPKEAVVGSMFALGTMFFPCCRGAMHRVDLLAGAAIFAALCFGNCALITVWERQAQDVRSRGSLLNAFPRLAARLCGLCFVLAGLAGTAFLRTRSPVFLPLALSGLLLGGLDRFRARLSPDALRVLADFALFTPLLFGTLSG